MPKWHHSHLKARRNKWSLEALAVSSEGCPTYKQAGAAMIRSLNRPLTSHTRVAGMSLKPKPAPLPFSTLPRERFEALAAWAVSQGARISDGVAFRESGDLGPGLVAARDLAPDENLIVLPQRCMISLDDGATSEAILAVCEVRCWAWRFVMTQARVLQ